MKITVLKINVLLEFLMLHTAMLMVLQHLTQNSLAMLYLSLAYVVIEIYKGLIQVNKMEKGTGTGTVDAP